MGRFRPRAESWYSVACVDETCVKGKKGTMVKENTEVWDVIVAREHSATGTKEKRSSANGGTKARRARTS